VNNTVTRRSGTLSSPRPKPTSQWQTRLAQVPRWALACLAGGVLLLLLSVGWFKHQAAKHAPVPLFAYELTPGQLRECSSTLARWQVEHQPNPDKNNLLVKPEERIELIGRLAAEDIPHRDFTAAQSVATLTPTRRQQLALEQGRLEESIGQSLRSLRGVQTATVSLAIPESTFGPENRPTASVIVHVSDGYKLPRTQAFGIARFVSGAVPCLRADDVAVLDQDGKQINTAEGASESWQLELQKQVDGYLAEKAQRILDRAYGEGRAECAINVELDYSQMEVKRTDVKPGEISGSQKMMEVFQNGETAPSGAVSMDEDEPLSSDPKKNKRYEKICEVRKHHNDEAYTWIVHKLPRISKLTCAVLIDSKGQGDNAAALVRGAIGFDSGRGDELSVTTVPMPVIEAGVPAGEPAAPAQPAQPYWPLVMGLLGATGACLALAVGLLGVRRVRLADMHKANAASGSAVDICDVDQRPNGSTALPAPATETRSLHSRLEELARNQPEKMASLLSTTYLNRN
jgi:flagellar M-ring protein FliF